LINSAGEVKAYPIRVGLTQESFSRWQDHPRANLGLAYELNRMRYGLKVLLPMTAFQSPVFVGKATKILLLTGRRTGVPGFRLRKMAWIRLYPVVFMNLVIGVGLPMMREYFLEGGSEDSCRLARIFFSRLRASFSLMRRAMHLEMLLGTDPAENAARLIQYMDQLG